MPMDQFITEEFPILDGDEDKIVKRLRKARKRLEKVFAALNVAGDVIIVCEAALEKQNVEHDTDIVNVIRRYASSAQMKSYMRIPAKMITDSSSS
jgi:hypothetical protein